MAKPVTILVFGDAKTVPSKYYDRAQVESLRRGEQPRIVRIDPAVLSREAKRLEDQFGLDEGPAYWQALINEGVPSVPQIAAVVYRTLPEDPTEEYLHNVEDEEAAEAAGLSYVWQPIFGVLPRDVSVFDVSNGKLLDRGAKLPVVIT